MTTFQRQVQRPFAPVLPARSARPVACVRSQRLQCRAAAVQENRFHQSIGAKLAAAGAAALLSLSTAGASLANEFDLLASETPTNNYLIDDAGVLNRTTKKNVNQDLEKLEKETGYRLEVATVRKLETENDAFAFGDKLVEKWYKTVDVGNNKGVLLIVTSAKEGALTGGPGFLKAVGDGLIDSVVSDSIPILTEQEKFNETVTSIVKRVGAVLNGQADPGAPIRAVNQTGRTYKTKDETAKSKNVTGTIVLVLLGISVVVPMLQYWGYTSKD